MKALPAPKHGTKHGPRRDTKTGRVSGGNPGNRGGGRHPWIWGDLCRQALEQSKAHIVLKKIIAGDLLEITGYNDDGTPIVGETKNADRIKAMQLALSYAIGLPVQPTIDLTPPSHKPMPVIAILAALTDVRDPTHSAQVRMLEAIHAAAEIVT